MDAFIQPIPKQEVGTYRPISLLSCLSKTMESAVLKRLRSLIPHPHQYTFIYCKGLGRQDNLAAIHSLMDRKDAVAVFLNLEKAFELANREAMINTFTKRGVIGKLVAWCNDYLTQRKACVRFQGHISNLPHFENGTPQGGILSPFLFNILMAELISTETPIYVHILAYADDRYGRYTHQCPTNFRQHILHMQRSRP